MIEGAGFSLDTILDLTPRQIAFFNLLHQRRCARADLRLMGTVRTAMHADKRQIERYLSEMDAD